MPPHLAAAEWWAHARRVVREGGLVVANVAVTPQSPAAAADARAARDAFAHVLAVGEHAVLKRKRRGNVVLVATTQPQSGAEPQRSGGGAGTVRGVGPLAYWRGRQLGIERNGAETPTAALPRRGRRPSNK